LLAIVDQIMGKSLKANEVSPKDLANSPQTHFARLRLEEHYEV